jgi:uncharacterized protein (TIGR02217 family)
MAFHDIRLSDDIERGAVGGPRFKTTILGLESGFEKRNIDWAEARGQWDVGYGLMSKEDTGAQAAFLDKIRDFFYARRGRAHSFRFKDWTDFDIGDKDNPTITNQQIALGDDTTTVFQIFKRYSSGGIDYDRPLTKIVGGTQAVLLDSVLQSDPGDYTIDLTTALITFGVAPASTGGAGPGGEEIVQVACEFDSHVRFDNDQLLTNLEVFSAGAMPQIEIVELRGAL